MIYFWGEKLVINELKSLIILIWVGKNSQRTMKRSISTLFLAAHFKINTSTTFCPPAQIIKRLPKFPYKPGDEILNEYIRFSRHHLPHAISTHIGMFSADYSCPLFVSREDVPVSVNPT